MTEIKIIWHFTLIFHKSKYKEITPFESLRDHKKHPADAGCFILNKLKKLASESL